MLVPAYSAEVCSECWGEAIALGHPVVIAALLTRAGESANRLITMSKATADSRDLLHVVMVSSPFQQRSKPQPSGTPHI